ncbi:tRNA dimethylallyltransferase [Andreesenia angusta]|uniref:tRNA dimethylallyltransferase n=1 Tax=Andreesenia angusta TaxID=39480 RepID=A0A1S1V8E1_9FIRM|nr:tRNA (adenosine(37)-N6)-dimethylallyltransferase MiaA [Andreesenia angusta]OHW62856.1 tRNA dimethylallyltransferase [Andreesenia angusta]
MKNLLVIVGPTAVGKTSLSVELAEHYGGEIISADSMQIYRGMDIGTAKIKADEMKSIPHYLLDVVAPDEEFSVSDFKEMTYACLGDVYSREKLPLIVGGTGLYVNSIVYKLDFADSGSDMEVRKKYMDCAEEFGNEYIYEKLKEVDPETAERLNLNDTKRIVRALEVYELTGEPMSKSYTNFREENDEFNLVFIGLDMERSHLYERINERVDIMLENGLVEEVKSLLENGYNSDMTSMKAIGYKEVVEYLRGVTTYDEMVEILKRNSRRFAKRQLTWFRRDKRIVWMQVDDYESLEELKREAISICDKKLREG